MFFHRRVSHSSNSKLNSHKMIFVYLILGLIALAVYYLTYNFDYWWKQNVPSPKARILLGNLPNLMLRKKHLTYDFDKIYA
jgi:uncharacterized membrane protein YcaP (DUF421 family)